MILAQRVGNVLHTNPAVMQSAYAHDELGYAMYQMNVASGNIVEDLA